MAWFENRDYHQDSWPKPNIWQSTYDISGVKTNMDRAHNEEREVWKLEWKLESTNTYWVWNLFKTLEANVGSREYTEILSSLYKKWITADNVSFTWFRWFSFNVWWEMVSIVSIWTTNNQNMINLWWQNFPDWRTLWSYIKSWNNIPIKNTERLEYVTAYDQLIRNTDSRTLFLEWWRVKFDQVWDNFDKVDATWKPLISNESIKIFKEKCYDAFSSSLQQRWIQKQDFIRYWFQKATVNWEKWFHIVVPSLWILPLKYWK